MRLSRFFLILAGLSLVVQISYSKALHPESGLKAYRTRTTRINQVVLPVTNFGPMGSCGNNEWPKGSGDQYVFSMGIWIGAMKEGMPYVSCGYDFLGSNFDMCPGPPEHVKDYGSQGAGAHPEDSIYFSTDVESEEEWREMTGNPYIIAHEDMWCDFNDLWEVRHAWEPNTGPLGLYITQNVFGFNSPDYQNMLFVLYEIKNVSGEKLEELYVALGCDMDVGDYSNDLVGCDIGRSLGWTYTCHEEGRMMSQPWPYYIGVRFLEGPRADDTVFVACHPDSEGYPWAHADTVLPGSTLVLTAFNKCKLGDASDELRRWRLISGHHIETGEYDPWRGVHDVTEEDKRMVLGCGPFDMDPGEIDTFLVGIMYSNGNTGAPGDNAATLEYLKKEGDAARLAYKFNFAIPSPPPFPELTAIPGDRKVTLIWDNRVEFAADPFVPVMRGLGDTVYKKYDFEGYRLFKTRTGLPEDWEELGQWDIKNDIVLLPGDIWYCGQNDTGTASGKESNNEGLVHSYVDTNVMNGITYRYALTSYDFNTRGNVYAPNESDIWCALEIGKREVFVRPRAESNIFVPPKVDSFTHTKGAANTVDLIANILGNLEVTGDEYEVHWGEIRQKDSLPVYTFNIRDVNKNAYISEKYLESTPTRDSVAVVSKRDSTITFVRIDSTVDSIIEQRTIIWDTIRADTTWLWITEISKPFDGLMIEGKLIVPLKDTLLLKQKITVDTLLIKPGPWQNWGDTSVVASHDTLDTFLIDSSNIYFGLPDSIFVDYDGGAHRYEGNLKVGKFYSSGIDVDVWPYQNRWAYHGGTDLEIRWEYYHGSPDSLSMRVFDLSNEGAEIPYDSAFGDNWCFITFSGWGEIPAGPFLTQDQSILYRKSFYVSGVKYYFNGGPSFNWDYRPDPGDVWKIYSSTNSVPPIKGNVFIFGTEKFSYGEEYDMDLIKVVPNPYLVRARWDRSKDIRKVEFTHLPSRCTIRIYTLDGVLVRKLEHDATKNPAIGGAEAWDLLTMNDQHIASGIYIYHVSTPTGQEKVGKFAVIK